MRQEPEHERSIAAVASKPPQQIPEEGEGSLLRNSSEKKLRQPHQHPPDRELCRVSEDVLFAEDASKSLDKPRKFESAKNLIVRLNNRGIPVTADEAGTLARTVCQPVKPVFNEDTKETLGE